LGTLCTDVPGNGTLDQPPCNRVTHGTELHVALQVGVLIAAWLAGGRRRSHRWVAWLLLACSLGGFIASYLIAGSY
jgi:thiosulfate reductase cytochrome b subunit